MTTAIVFGASRGLGKALVDELEGRGCSAVGFTRADADVTDRFKIDKALWTACVDFRTIDLCINCAAEIGPLAPLHTSAPLLRWRDSVMTNVVGCGNVMSAIIPTMKKQGHGTIVNISSGAARRPIEGWSAYCAGKAAVEMLTQCAQLENPELRIMSIDPGVIDTGMQEKIRDAGLGVVVPKEDLQTPRAAARRVLDQVLVEA